MYFNCYIIHVLAHTRPVLGALYDALCAVVNEPLNPEREPKLLSHALPRGVYTAAKLRLQPVC